MKLADSGSFARGSVNPNTKFSETGKYCPSSPTVNWCEPLCQLIRLKLANVASERFSPAVTGVSPGLGDRLADVVRKDVVESNVASGANVRT